MRDFVALILAVTIFVVLTGGIVMKSFHPEMTLSEDSIDVIREMVSVVAGGLLVWIGITK